MRPPVFFLAAALSAAWLVAPAPASAQQKQTPSQAQPPQAQPQSPQATIPDEQLNAAAAALGRVATLQQNYRRQLATAPEADKKRLAGEANEAIKKAVTDQGLSIDQYNSILETAQNDPELRDKLVEQAQRSVKER